MIVIFILAAIILIYFLYTTKQTNENLDNNGIDTKVKDIVVLERNDSAETNYYQVTIPDNLNLDNHAYYFYAGTIGKKNMKTNKIEYISYDSLEGIIVANIRRGYFKKYIYKGKNDIMIFTGH